MDHNNILPGIINFSFSCSKKCLEKYSTVQSLEKHAIEFHQGIVLAKKDFSMKNKADILLKEYKSEPKRRATFADWVNPYVTGKKYALKIYDKFTLVYRSKKSQ